MQAVLITFSGLGLVVLLSTWGAWWLFPRRRPQLEASAWFAFAPLVFGLLGLIATIVVVLLGEPDSTSPALAGNSALVLFNLYNGYQSAEAYFKRRQKH